MGHNLLYFSMTGAIKFDKLSTRFEDYNMLIRATAELDPRVPAEQVHLIEIDATDSSVSGWFLFFKDYFK